MYGNVANVQKCFNIYMNVQECKKIFFLLLCPKQYGNIQTYKNKRKCKEVYINVKIIHRNVP